MTASATPAPPKDADEQPRAHAGAFVTLCFAAATFLGAFLLFLVQPLIAKFILPWFGGGAAVWTTCLMFFQTALLAGYLYAYLGVKGLVPRAQRIVHVLVVAGATAAALPTIAPAAQWQPSAEAAGMNPIGQILLLLTVAVGVPCVALAATSPVLHTWYSQLRPGAAVYRLYALSNLGSLLALLAYPLVIEPFLPRKTQALAWSVAMGVFAVLCALCAWLASAARPRAVEAPPIASDESVSKATGKGDRMTRGLLWLALPACASALLLATTNTMTQDLAPVPFLWVMLLGLYLLTFIIAFDRPRWYRRVPFAWALAAAVAATAWVLYQDDEVVRLVVIVLSLAGTLFVGCMMLHGELARLRPPPERLTAYYLTIAAGGALGGLLVAVGAPLLLRSYFELAIALWACCFLAFLTPHLVERRMPAGPGGLAAIAGVMLLAPILWTVFDRKLPNSTLISRSRDFYGVLTVREQEDTLGARYLFHHGGIMHGNQYRRPSLRTTPTSYYHPKSGVGLVLGKYGGLPTPRRVGVVGLGTGTVAAYANAGDVYRFYEIGPRVVDVARTWFTYLADAQGRGAACDVVVGDGRLSLEGEAPQRFDALVLDAFSGDAIPVHLLTSEAFELYRKHLGPSGVLCVHVSNHYLDLQTVVAAAARKLGWHAVRLNTPPEGVFPDADWVLLSPDPAAIERLRKFGAHRPPREKPGFVPWTDEYANLLGILH